MVSNIKTKRKHIVFFLISSIFALCVSFCFVPVKSVTMAEEAAEGVTYYSLRSLPDGTADTVDKDGMLQQRIGNIVYTGNEGISWDSLLLSGSLSGYRLFSTSNVPQDITPRTAFSLSNRFKKSMFNAADSFFFGSDSIVFILLDSIASSSSSFNTWLRSNNVDVLYPINDAYIPAPIQLTNPLPEIKTYNGSTTLTTDEGVTLSASYAGGETVTGDTIIFEDTRTGKYLSDLTISGKSSQAAEPSPTSPVPIVNVTSVTFKASGSSEDDEYLYEPYTGDIYIPPVVEYEKFLLIPNDIKFGYPGSPTHGYLRKSIFEYFRQFGFALAGSTEDVTRVQFGVFSPYVYSENWTNEPALGHLYSISGGSSSNFILGSSADYMTYNGVEYQKYSVINPFGYNFGVGGIYGVPSSVDVSRLKFIDFSFVSSNFQYTTTLSQLASNYGDNPASLMFRPFEYGSLVTYGKGELDVAWGQGHLVGVEEGWQVGYAEGRQEGYDSGYEWGYSQGYSKGLADADVPLNTSSWFKSVINTIATVLDIEIFPGLKLVYLIGLPLLLGVIFLIFKLIK